jgi:hypothetical protein
MRRKFMPTITTKDGVQIFYKDWGKGQPIVFSHGWPLTADDWDGQMLFFGQRGYRVIAHDRRGHGRSTQTWDGNEMDTYADDLAALTEKLDLRDAIHVGIVLSQRALSEWDSHSLYLGTKHPRALAFLQPAPTEKEQLMREARVHLAVSGLEFEWRP